MSRSISLFELGIDESVIVNGTSMLVKDVIEEIKAGVDYGYSRIRKVCIQSESSTRGTIEFQSVVLIK